MDPETAYDVLELDQAAGESDIRQAYRRLTKKYHPDMTEGETREHWIQINEAKETLLNGRHSTSQQEGGTEKTSTTQNTRSSAGGGETTGQSQRSYQRGHTDRQRRRARSNASHSHSTSNEHRQDGHQVSFEDLDQHTVGSEVKIEGAVADVTTSTAADVELVVTLVSTKNSDNRIEIYIHDGLSDRPTFRSEDLYRITGVLRDGERSDGPEVHVSDGHDITRVPTDRDWSHIAKQYHRETSTSRTEQSKTTNTETTTTRDTSIKSSVYTALAVVLWLLIWPGTVVQQYLRPLYQIVVVLMATGLLGTISTSTVLDVIYLAILLFFSFGGMLAMGLTSISLLWTGDNTAGLGFLVGFVVIAAYYALVKFWMDVE